MPRLVVFDELELKLLIPEDADAVIAESARAALDNPQFVTALRDAIHQMFASVPALAVLSVVVEV